MPEEYMFLQSLYYGCICLLQQWSQNNCLCHASMFYSHLVSPISTRPSTCASTFSLWSHIVCTVRNKVQSFTWLVLIITSQWDFSGGALWPRHSQVLAKMYVSTTIRTLDFFVVSSEQSIIGQSLKNWGKVRCDWAGKMVEKGWKGLWICWWQ